MARTDARLELQKARKANAALELNPLQVQRYAAVLRGTSLPPSLLELTAKPHGHFYAAIAEGYGVMPSFAGELDVMDRWAVVAYVRALQSARGAPGAGPAQNRIPQENR